MQKKSYKNNFYHPAEDTFFFAENLGKEYGHTALDIGTGSGYLAEILSSKFPLVVSTDINFESLKMNPNEKLNPVCCNGADALQCKFDLAVSNLPYLPSDTISDITVDGGKKGLEVPLNIIRSAVQSLKNGGKLLFLTSSLADYQELLDEASNLGTEVSIVARKKLFFEELILVKAIKTKD